MAEMASAGELTVRGVRLGLAHHDAPRVDIHIRNGVIAQLRPVMQADAHPGASKPSSLAEIDATELMAFPGFVNAHAHSNESFEQGAYEGLALEEWLALAYPPLVSEVLPERWHYLRAAMLAMQSLRSGVTALHDDFLNPACSEAALGQVLAAYSDVGLRACVAVTMADRSYREGLPLAETLWPAALRARLASQARPCFASQTDFFKNALALTASRGNPRLQLSLGPRGPQRCTPEMLGQLAQLASQHAVPVHMHVLESRAQALTAQAQHGRSFITVLDEAGLLTESLALNHAVWLTAADIERIARRGARVVHNPLSNFKLASGLCPLKPLLAAGVDVALGTDGAATGDSVDYFDSLRMAALVHRLDATEEAPAPNARKIVDMATRAGAATMGNAGRHGEIAVGQSADLTLLHAHDPAFLPLNDGPRQLCYAATSRSVHTVIVGGQVVFAHGRCTRVDEAGLWAEIAAAAEEFRRMRLSRDDPEADALRAALSRMQSHGRARSHELATLNRICLT